MQTVQEVIVYMELELADAYEQYDATKGKDAQAALYHMVKISIITNLLDAIK